MGRRNALVIVFGALVGASQLKGVERSVIIQNNTGKTANDLHVRFAHKTSYASCPQLPTASLSPDGGFSYSFSGGTVPPLGSATIKWSTKFSSDQIQDAYWTLDGINIGSVGESTVSFYYQVNPDGIAVVLLLNNNTNPVTYSDLRIFTGADQNFFKPETFAEHMTSGQFVQPSVPLNGTAASGAALFGSFVPSLGGYTAASVQINGSELTIGSSPFSQLGPPFRSGNRFVFDMSAEPGRTYSLESSTNLLNWNAIATATVSADPPIFTPPTSDAFTIYRAKIASLLSSPSLETPCSGGVFNGGYTVNECITGFWHIVYYDSYSCPPDWQQRTYRVKQINTGQPCTTAFQELLTSGSASNATAVRNVFFLDQGAFFFNSAAGIDYPYTLFPPEGTIELDLTASGAGRILDTRGTATRLAGDALIALTSTGKVSFAIDPTGGQDPTSLRGVTTATTVNDGSYHLLSFSYGSGGLKVYVDGALEDSNLAITAPLIRSSITFGDYVDTVRQSFQGAISSIRTSSMQDDVAQNTPQSFTFINDSDVSVTGLQVRFRGSGGTLNNARMLSGPSGTVINAQGDQIIITFPSPVLAGTSTAFSLKTRFVPISIDSASWTVNGEAVGAAH